MDDRTVHAARAGREAAARFGRQAGPPREGAAPAPGLDPALSNALASVMDRVAGVLEGQAVYRREIAALQDEVAGLRAALARADAVRLQALEAQARACDEREAALRTENARLREYVRQRVEKDNPLRPRPGEAFLDLPLVIRSGRGEFLGVAGRQRGAFTSRALLALMRSSQRAGRDVQADWEREGGHWVLRVAVCEAGREQHLVLMLRETVTPSGNRVARLEHMIVDGNEVPDGVLVSLFRQIKDSFDT